MMDNYIRDNAFINAFGVNLRQIRKQNKLSMEKLAHKAGIEYSQLARIERGEINTSISTAHIIAKALNIPVKDLFDFAL